MFKTALFAVVALVMAGAAQTKDAASEVRTVRHDTAMPPDGYGAQWWTHPKGCEYSRA